ncbi:MAG: Fe-Mn family superoxide dismutase [Fimbriimonadaceae bacterium]|jgi:Fe-Mn family superoxide dismutase|nr:Fe-Mn family superoxide dismutase [Fimbriimonadaceae bacterium]
MSDLTRRQVLAGAATVATTAALSAGAFAETFQATASQSAPATLAKELILPVPTQLDAKVYTTARVGISKATHDAHLRLFASYATQTNNIRTALLDLRNTTAAPNQIFSQMRALKVNYAFAYGGYLNHLVYFETIGGQGGKPQGLVLQEIEKAFGSWENFLADFRATALSARGWVFVARDRLSGHLFTYIGDAQDTYPMWENDLILACDVYEHAFWTDFPGSRAAYLDAYLKVIDWAAVEKRLRAAL